MMDWIDHALPWITAGLFAAAICYLMHRGIRERMHWMMACIVNAVAYVGLAQTLDTSSLPQHFGVIPWVFFVAALFAFYRYRFRRTD